MSCASFLSDRPENKHLQPQMGMKPFSTFIAITKYLLKLL